VVYSLQIEVTHPNQREQIRPQKALDPVQGMASTFQSGSHWYQHPSSNKILPSHHREPSLSISAIANGHNQKDTSQQLLLSFRP
jgi:hypothetical protein